MIYSKKIQKQYSPELLKLMKNRSLENILEDLSNNTMFRLSLGSKELFHSNYWSMLLNKYQNKIANVFYSNYKQTDKLKEIKREKEHTDLSFEVNDNLIIIENKCKSKPYIEQLKKYASDNKNKNLERIILISYIPAHIQDDNLDFKLEHISYKDLCNRLKNSNIKDDVYLNDYINMLELLNELKECVSLKLNNKTYKENYDTIENIKEKAEKINFYSFIHKVTLMELYHNLIKDGIILDWENVDFSRDHKVFLDLMKCCNDGYLCEIESIGITISAKENIRHKMEIIKNDKSREEIEDTLNELSQNELSWFLSNCKGYKRNPLKFKGFNNTKTLTLYKYTENSILDLKYNEIKDFILNEMNNIEKHLNLQ